MQELIRAILSALVDNPEYIEIVEVIGHHSCVLSVQVAQQDIGKVIGRRGVHAQAIRTIMSAHAGKLRRCYVLELIEDDLLVAGEDPAPGQLKAV